MAEAIDPSDVLPQSNLPAESQQWRREIERRLNAALGESRRATSRAEIARTAVQSTNSMVSRERDEREAESAHDRGADAPTLAPSAPQLATRLGTFSAEWDGLLGGELPPIGFSHVVAEFVTSEPEDYVAPPVPDVGQAPPADPGSNDPWVAGAQTLSAAGRVVFTSVMPGQTVWVRLRAVTRSGLSSWPSPHASVLVEGVATPDLAQEINDTLDEAFEDANAALAEASSARSEAQQAIADAGLALSDAQQAAADATAAQTSAQEAAATAQSAAQTAQEAQSAADQAAEDALAAAGIAEGKGVVLFQPNAPAAEYRLPTTLWIDTDDGNVPKRWNGSAWVVVQDAAIQDAAQAAASAQSTADAATSAAQAAQSAADTAAQAASNAQSSADAADAKAVAAQAAADAADAVASNALSNAATAQQAADAAQTAADDAAADAAAAAGIAEGKGKVIIQGTAPAAADRLPQNLWIDTANGNVPKRWNGSQWVAVRDQAAIDAANAAATAQQAADDAQQTADDAVADAAAANSAAQAAQDAADAAQATADNAATAAANAQQSANEAQSTATGAQAAANAADAKADAAQTAADDAAQDAATAAGIASGKADVLIQGTTPPAAMRKATTLWIDTTGGNNTPKRWNGSAWVAVTDKAAVNAANAAAAADAKADAADAKAQAAQTAAANAQTAADAAAGIANAAQDAADAAQATGSAAASQAAQALSDAADAQADATQAIADAGAALTEGAAARSEAQAAQADATAALSDAADAQADASTALSRAQTARNEAAAAQGDATAALSNAASAADAASQAIANAATAQTTADGKNKVSRGTGTGPSGASPGDLHFQIDSSNNVIGVRMWNGSAWVPYALTADSVLVPGSAGSTVIADGAITTKHLTITDGSNLVEDDRFDFIGGGSPGWGRVSGSLADISRIDDPAWGPAAQIRAGADTALRFFNARAVTSSGFPVEGGKEVFAAALVRNESTDTTLRVRIREAKGDRSYATMTQAFSVGPGESGYFSGSVIMSTDAAFARLDIYLTGDGSTDGPITIARPEMRRMNAGELIVDGAIVADHLAANAVTAEKINAGAVTAEAIAAGSIATEHVAAGSITASKMTLTDTTNLVDDPNFESATVATGSASGAPWWNSGEGAVSFTSTNGAPGRAILFASSGGFAQVVNGNMFTVREGEKFSVSARCQNQTGAPITMRLQWLNENRGGLTQTDIPLSVGSWSTTVAEVEAPSGAFYGRLVFRSHASPTGNAWISKPRVLRKANADLIVDGAVTADKINANAVTAEKIASGAVIADKIDANAVTANKIASNAVTAAKIASNAVTTAKLNANAVTAAKIAANTITANEIAANAITAEELAANSVIAGKIASNAVTTAKLNANAVTATKIAANAVTAEKIIAGAVTTAKLDAGAVTTEKILAGAVTTDKVDAGAITAAKIDTDAIEARHLSTGSVQADAIAAGAITTEHLAAGAITTDRLEVGELTDSLLHNPAFSGLDGWEVVFGGAIHTSATVAPVTVGGTPALQVDIPGLTGTGGVGTSWWAPHMSVVVQADDDHLIPFGEGDDLTRLAFDVQFPGVPGDPSEFVGNGRMRASASIEVLRPDGSLVTEVYPFGNDQDQAWALQGETQDPTWHTMTAFEPLPKSLVLREGYLRPKLWVGLRRPRTGSATVTDNPAIIRLPELRYGMGSVYVGEGNIAAADVTAQTLHVSSQIKSLGLFAGGGVISGANQIRTENDEDANRVTIYPQGIQFWINGSAHPFYNLTGERWMEVLAATQVYDWTDLTLQNGWSTYSGWEPQVRRDGNIVTFRGRLGGGTAQTIASTLPTWARPSRDTSLNVLDSSGSGLVTVRVRPNGHLIPMTGYLFQEQMVTWNVA